MIPIERTYALIGLSPSPAQLALAKTICGEQLTFAEQEIWRACTGRADSQPAIPYQEATVVAGRKSGKSELIASPILIHRAAIDTEGPGVYLLVMPFMANQSRSAWTTLVHQVERGYPGLIDDVREPEGRLLLRNSNEIRYAWGNFRYLRGPKYTVVAVDEACFFVSDSPEDGGANPLEFILDSVVGGMVATRNPLLLLLSTPWNKSGTVWNHFRERDSNPARLVWRADTLTMNPFANRQLMERHRKDRGENFYRREYLAEFSEDSFAFIESADVDAAVMSNVPFLPPRAGKRYVMGLDPGRKRDHFGAAIAHREDDVVVVDWAAEWRPGLFGLKYASVLPENWKKAREYGIRKIASDQVDFGGIEASIPSTNGHPEFEMERVMTGRQSGAELADTSRGLFATRKLLLPDQSGLTDEFKRLADYLTQGGARDIRAKRGHDDRSRACMLAIHQAFTVPQSRAPMIEVLNVDHAPHPKNVRDLYDVRDDFGFDRRAALVEAAFDDLRH